MSKQLIAGALLGVLAVLGLPAQEFVSVRGGGNLLHRAPVDYPREALERGISGEVVLEVNVNEKGEVSDARVAAWAAGCSAWVTAYPGPNGLTGSSNASGFWASPIPSSRASRAACPCAKATPSRPNSLL